MTDNGLHLAYCEPRYGDGKRPVKVIGPDPDWPTFVLVRTDDGRVASVHRDSVRFG